jgi:hypothetical protein
MARRQPALEPVVNKSGISETLDWHPLVDAILGSQISRPQLSTHPLVNNTRLAESTAIPMRDQGFGVFTRSSRTWCTMISLRSSGRSSAAFRMKGWGVNH